MAFFSDFRAAFDTVDGNTLWRILIRNKVNKTIIERIKEIYEETVNVVRIKDRYSDKFSTTKGLRQGCPLSPTLFAIYIANIDKVFERAQVGVVVLGKEKICTLRMYAVRG